MMKNEIVEQGQNLATTILHNDIFVLIEQKTDLLNVAEIAFKDAMNSIGHEIGLLLLQVEFVLPVQIDVYFRGWRRSELLDVEKEKRFEKKEADPILLAIGRIQKSGKDRAKERVEV